MSLLSVNYKIPNGFYKINPLRNRSQMYIFKITTQL
jgi:hypothetical protein